MTPWNLHRRACQLSKLKGTPNNLVQFEMLEDIQLY